MPHEDCVNLIKRSGDTLALKVITANMSSMVHSQYAASHSLPYRRKGKLFLQKKKMRIYVKNIFQHPFVRVLKNLLVVCLHPFVLACFSKSPQLL